MSCSLVKVCCESRRWQLTCVEAVVLHTCTLSADPFIDLFKCGLDRWFIPLCPCQLRGLLCHTIAVDHSYNSEEELKNARELCNAIQTLTSTNAPRWRQGISPGWGTAGGQGMRSWLWNLGVTESLSGFINGPSVCGLLKIPGWHFWTRAYFLVIVNILLPGPMPFIFLVIKHTNYA